MNYLKKTIYYVILCITAGLLFNLFFSWGKHEQLKQLEQTINSQYEVIHFADNVFSSAYIIEYADTNYTVEKYLKTKNSQLKK